MVWSGLRTVECGARNLSVEKPPIYVVYRQVGAVNNLAHLRYDHLLRKWRLCLRSDLIVLISKLKFSYFTKNTSIVRNTLKK